MQGRAETQYTTIDDPGPHDLAFATTGCLLLREVQAAHDSSIPSGSSQLRHRPGSLRCNAENCMGNIP
eukprot:11426365-Prorocentrum_lima.AAC.1